MTKNKNSTNDTAKLGWRERLAAKNAAKENPKVEAPVVATLQGSQTAQSTESEINNASQFKPEPYPKALIKKVKGKKDKTSKPAKKDKLKKEPKSKKPTKDKKNIAGGDFPKIRYYLIEKRVDQKGLALRTRTSANTIYRLTHKANLTPSINYLIYLVLKHEYKLKLTEAEFNAMLK